MQNSKLVQQNFDLSVYPDSYIISDSFTQQLKNVNKGKLGTFKDEFSKTFINSEGEEQVNSIVGIHIILIYRICCFEVQILQHIITC
jgi:hypothetical protein